MHTNWSHIGAFLDAFSVDIFLPFHFLCLLRSVVFFLCGWKMCLFVGRISFPASFGKSFCMNMPHVQSFVSFPLLLLLILLLFSYSIHSHWTATERAMRDMIYATWENEFLQFHCYVISPEKLVSSWMLMTVMGRLCIKKSSRLHQIIIRYVLMTIKNASMQRFFKYSHRQHHHHHYHNHQPKRIGVRRLLAFFFVQIERSISFVA